MASSPPAQEAQPDPIPEWDGRPVDGFELAAAHLRKPFTGHALKWKVQAAFPVNRTKQARTEANRATAGLLVPYIDARLVIERLNALIPHLWAARFEEAGANGYLRCFLTVRHPRDERLDVTRTDVGFAGELKARQSDALKRAAVHFGVGVSLYALPKQMLKVGSGKGQLRLSRAFEPIVDANTETFLGSMYDGWLGDVRNTFGAPLDHGDVKDAGGDLEVEAPPSTEEEPEPEHPALDDGRTFELVDQIGAANKGKHPPAALKQMVDAARRHPDHSRLEALLESLTAKED